MDFSFYDFTTSVLFPVVIFIVMLGMGLSLTVQSFIDISKNPKGILIGLFGQLIFLPAVAFLFASGFDLSPPLAMGLILIATCPGGSSSNAIVFAIRGKLALSVTLTAISSVAILITLPLWVQFGLSLYSSGEYDLVISNWDIIKNLLMVMLLPVVLGMVIKHYKTELAYKLEQPLRKLSLVLLLMIIAISVYNVRDFISVSVLPILYYSMAMAITLLLGAYWLPKLFSLDKASRIALAVEIGVQNTSLALFVGSSLLGWDELTITAIVYGIVNYTFIGIMVYVLKRKKVR